jgi:hypothetical protein
VARGGGRRPPAILLGYDALVLWTGKKRFEFEWLLLGSWKPDQGMIAQRIWPAKNLQNSNKERKVKPKEKQNKIINKIKIRK